MRGEWCYYIEIAMFLESFLASITFSMEVKGEPITICEPLVLTRLPKSLKGSLYMYNFACGASSFLQSLTIFMHVGLFRHPVSFGLVFPRRPAVKRMGIGSRLVKTFSVCEWLNGLGANLDDDVDDDEVASSSSETFGGAE